MNAVGSCNGRNQLKMRLLQWRVKPRGAYIVTVSTRERRSHLALCDLLLTVLFHLSDEPVGCRLVEVGVEQLQRCALIALVEVIPAQQPT